MKRIVPVFLAVVSLCWLIGSADCSNNKTVADNQNDAYEIDLLVSDSIHGVYATDTMDAYAELAPNDSSNGTYYYQGVPGHIIRHHLKSDSSDIFVDYNITFLELHTEITKSLFCRTHSMLREWGFVSDNDTIAPFRAEDKNSQKEIMDAAIGWSKDCFYKEVKDLYEYGEYGYYIFISIYPVWLTNDIVTYCIKEETYTGGAHGNYDYYLESFDRETGESLFEKDILIGDKMEKVSTIITRHLAAIHECSTVNEYLGNLNKWRNDLDQFFTYEGKKKLKKYTARTFPIGTAGLRKEGIVFSYPRYSIAPGVEAVPTVFIPYDEIRDCLKIKF